LIYLILPPITLLAALADTFRFLAARFFLLLDFAFFAMAVDLLERRGYTTTL